MATITVSLDMARRYPALLAELGLYGPVVRAAPAPAAAAVQARAVAAPAPAAPAAPAPAAPARAAPAAPAPRLRHCGRCGGTGHNARNSACPGRVADVVADSEDEGDGDCIICCTRNATTTLNPCGHKTMCYACTLRVISDRPVCPICRAAVTRVS